MKRIQMCKNVNRNNNSFSHLNRKASSHLNSISPEILVGQIWLQEDEPPAVEIIELNTSDDLDDSSPVYTHNNNLDHAWSYASNERMQQIEDNYKINKKARERRRMNQENHFLARNTPTNTNNQFFNNNYYSDMVANHIEDKKQLNHQVNCFTIINKHFINSDTSSEGEFADVEIITSNDILMEPKTWDARNNPYDEEMVAYDSELDKETRTIWIYSYKNKQRLSEDGYEFYQTATKESSCSTSGSVESDEEQTKDKSTNVGRVGSPIPPAYIPRLNLSLAPTLPTVTEVSEPNKQPSPNGSLKSPKIRFQKPKNSWFVNESEKFDSGRSIRKLEKSTNIVNWMALSPRERRRRSKEVGDKWEGSFLKLETLPNTELKEQGDKWEGKFLKLQTTELTEDSQQQTHNKSAQDNALRLQVDVDVHVSLTEKNPEKRSLGTPDSVDVSITTNADDCIANKIKHAVADFKGCAKDRGDHDMKFAQTQQVATVLTDTYTISEPIKTSCASPIEKVDKAVWEREENEEEETSSYDYLTNRLACFSDETNVADELWMKNTKPLLRPSEWDEYLPIAESPFSSLHLSVATIVEKPQPWFKRFIQYMNCCKVESNKQ